MYDLENEKIIDFINKYEVERPAIQLPDGLKDLIPEILKSFKDMGVNPVIISDSCYGACDLADHTAERIGCDALIHYGHADMGFRTEIPTLYIEARIKANPNKLLERIIPILKNSKWGLITTVQHIGSLREIKEFLSENNIDTIIGEAGCRTKYPGQILGCDWTAAKSVSSRVDGFIYIGTGRFHPIGISLTTNKRIIIINPISEYHTLLSPNPDKFLEERKKILSRAAYREKIGIIVCTKTGQERLRLAEELRSKFESTRYEALVLTIDELTPEKLGQFRDWAFVSTACPRIALDDASLFDNPIITPFEARVLLGEEDLKPYQLDELRQSG